jgi:hypothetical protein
MPAGKLGSGFSIYLCGKKGCRGLFNHSADKRETLEKLEHFSALKESPSSWRV